MAKRRTPRPRRTGSRTPAGRTPKAASPPDVADAEIAHAKLLINPAAFGFAERLDGQGSIFIPAGRTAGAMDGDEVVVSHWPAARGPEGTVRSVVKRARTRITGVLRKYGRRHVVEPDDPRVLGQAEVLGGPGLGRAGMVVVGAIVDYPDPWNPDFSVRVERNLGPPGELNTEVLKILLEHGVDPQFSAALDEAAQEVPTRVTKADRVDRDDLRGLPFMTIDPDTARDFDDAVCVELLGKDARRAKMRLHVAVADVSHYVRPGDPFDDEAQARCFSLYLPDRAISMLPEPLSSGICSLVPRKDRLAMVVTLDVDAAGKAGEPNVRAAVIRSQQRLSYAQVAQEFSGRRKLPDEIRARIDLLREVADRLRRHRMRRGAVELQLTEVKISLDEDDPTRIRSIAPSRSTPEMGRAYNLIEELMVAANEAVGRLAKAHRLPVVYRVHDKPDVERIERFAAIVDLLGAQADPQRLRTPRGMQAFLKKVAKHGRLPAIHGLLLRSLAQAEYGTHNLGHFALGASAYVHFTSPIRRYPDLISHRVLKAYLAQRGRPAGYSPPKMPALRDVTTRAAASSTRERAIIAAERDAKSLYAAVYMRDRIGDRFEGAVSGLSSGGVFVTLDDPPVDGMIRRQAMERETRQAYQLDDLGARMVASRTGKTLTVGDRVIVEIIDASASRRQIDLALIAQLSD